MPHVVKPNVPQDELLDVLYLFSEQNQVDFPIVYKEGCCFALTLIYFSYVDNFGEQRAEEYLDFLKNIVYFKDKIEQIPPELNLKIKELIQLLIDFQPKKFSNKAAIKPEQAINNLMPRLSSETNTRKYKNEYSIFLFLTDKLFSRLIDRLLPNRRIVFISIRKMLDLNEKEKAHALGLYRLEDKVILFDSNRKEVFILDSFNYSEMLLQNYYDFFSFNSDSVKMEINLEVNFLVDENAKPTSIYSSFTKEICSWNKDVKFLEDQIKSVVQRDFNKRYTEGYLVDYIIQPYLDEIKKPSNKDPKKLNLLSNEVLEKLKIIIINITMHNKFELMLFILEKYKAISYQTNNQTKFHQLLEVLQNENKPKERSESIWRHTFDLYPYDRQENILEMIQPFIPSNENNNNDFNSRTSLIRSLSQFVLNGDKESVNDVLKKLSNNMLEQRYLLNALCLSASLDNKDIFDSIFQRILLIPESKQSGELKCYVNLFKEIYFWSTKNDHDKGVAALTNLVSGGTLAEPFDYIYRRFSSYFNDAFKPDRYSSVPHEINVFHNIKDIFVENYTLMNEMRDFKKNITSSHFNSLNIYSNFYARLKLLEFTMKKIFELKYANYDDNRKERTYIRLDELPLPTYSQNRHSFCRRNGKDQITTIDVYKSITQEEEFEYLAMGYKREPC